MKTGLNTGNIASIIHSNLITDALQTLRSDSVRTFHEQWIWRWETKRTLENRRLRKSCVTQI